MLPNGLQIRSSDVVSCSAAIPKKLFYELEGRPGYSRPSFSEALHAAIAAAVIRPRNGSGR